MEETKMNELTEKFDEAVSGLTMICTAQINNVNRIDNLFNTYDRLKELGLPGMVDNKNDSIAYVQKMVDEEAKNYEIILEILEGLTLDEMIADKYKDPFEPFIPDRYGITDYEQMYLAYLTFVCIRPYGEKLEQLRNTLIEIKDSDN